MPPSSFFVRCSNVAYCQQVCQSRQEGRQSDLTFTTGGPALNSWLWPSTMTLKWDIVALQRRTDWYRSQKFHHGPEPCQRRNVGPPGLKVGLDGPPTR